MWMCRQTDKPACDLAVAEVEQQLETEEDHDFRGLLNDRVLYSDGLWVPLVDSNGTDHKDQHLVGLARDAMQLHSILEDDWMLSTMSINEGTKWHHDETVLEDRALFPKPLILSSAHPLKKQGEHMFIPPAARRFSIEQILDGQE
jgi:hypothetical protein